MNLYELIKKNNFQGFSLALIRRFAYALLQCLKLLYRDRIIHCDLKPVSTIITYLLTSSSANHCIHKYSGGLGAPFITNQICFDIVNGTSKPKPVMWLGFYIYHLLTIFVTYYMFLSPSSIFVFI